MARSVKLKILEGAARPLPARWRDLLDDLPETLRDLYEERAAIIEFDGGEKRKTAERRAFEAVVAQSDAGAAWLADISARSRRGGGLSAARVS